MGNSTSQFSATPVYGNTIYPQQTIPTSKQEDEINSKLMVSKGVVSKLREINNVLGHQKNNNISAMINDVKSYAQKLQIPAEMIPQIESRVKKFQDVLTKHGYPDVKKGIASNDLYNYMSLYNDPQVRILKDQLMTEANEVVKDTALKGELDKFVDKLVLLNQNNRFLEYKYITLNLFMIAFVKRIYEAFFMFMEDVKKFNTLRTEAQSASANALVKKLVDVMNKANIGTMDIQTTNDINKGLEQLLQTIDQWKDKLDKLDESHRQKFVQMVDALYDAGMTDMIPGRRAVSPFKRTPSPPRSLFPDFDQQQQSIYDDDEIPSQNGDYYGEMSQQPSMSRYPNINMSRYPSDILRSPTRRFTRSSVETPDEYNSTPDINYRNFGGKGKKTKKIQQKGGFVRDGSKFPDEFYYKDVDS